MQDSFPNLQVHFIVPIHNTSGALCVIVVTDFEFTAPYTNPVIVNVNVKRYLRAIGQNELNLMHGEKMNKGRNKLHHGNITFMENKSMSCCTQPMPIDVYVYVMETLSMPIQRYLHPNNLFEKSARLVSITKIFLAAATVTVILAESAYVFDVSG